MHVVFLNYHFNQCMYVCVCLCMCMYNAFNKIGKYRPQITVQFCYLQHYFAKTCSQKCCFTHPFITLHTSVKGPKSTFKVEDYLIDIISSYIVCCTQFLFYHILEKLADVLVIISEITFIIFLKDISKLNSCHLNFENHCIWMH